MRFFLIPALLCSLWAYSGEKQPAHTNARLDTLRIVFCSAEEASRLLGAEDAVSERWSPFDLDSRLKKSGATREELLQFASLQAQEWTQEEKQALSRIVTRFNGVVRERRLDLPFPSEIKLVKSTLLEEGGAVAYTRSNYIVLRGRFVTATPDFVLQIFAHEVFHVLTRNDAGFREKMYRLIGFEVLPGEIEFPEELKARFITNPDVVRHDSYATFTIGGRTQDCCMVIHADRDYDGGGFMSYLKTSLIAIDAQSRKAILKDGRAIVYSVDDATDFHDKVGSNTAYIMDPEEVLADNFSYLFHCSQTLPSPDLLKRMEEACQ